MTVVRLCIDHAGVADTTEGQVVVNELQDYARAHREMTGALHAGKPLTIVVRHRACAAWLQRAAAKYGPERVTVQEITRRGRLGELWSVTVPAWVSEQDIERSDLLALPPLRAQPGQSFEDVILEAFYSPFLTYDRLPLNRLPELLEGYDQAAWEAADRRPLLQAIRRRQLEAWQEAAQSEGEKALVALLQADPEKLRGVLSRCRLLQNYPPEVGRRVLGQTWDQLRGMQLNLNALRVDEGAIRDALDQVEVHFEATTKGGVTSEGIETLLAQVSGCTVAEFNRIERLLRLPAVKASRELLARVRKAFTPIQERVAARLADLDLLVEPPRPSQPDPQWDADAWLAWAVREYLPYRFWLEEMGRLDQEVAGFAETYGDWLYDAFPGLTPSYPSLVYRAIQNSGAYLGADGVLLFIMMDNFNHKFFPEFQAMMQARGYFLQANAAYLSMLPTATEVSKKCMAVGQPQPFSGTAYEKPVEKTWAQYFAGKRVKYIPYVGDMKGIHQHEHDIYVLNYTPIDGTLHDDTRQTGLSHAEAVRQHLHNLATTIHAFALRLGIEKRLTVAICSDHGATVIPADTPNIIDKAFYAGRVLDKHHRYVSISDAQMKALPDNARFQCYFIERERFQLDANYLAARGYYRFAVTDENSYVHGGLTPEETIVPFAIFQRVAAKLKKPTVRLLTEELRYGVKSRILLEIVNPNEQSLLDLRAEIRTPGVEAEAVELTELPANAVTEIAFDGARVRRGTPGEPKQLAVRLTYQFAGSPYTDDFEFPITIKTMMTTTFDLSQLG